MQILGTGKQRAGKASRIQLGTATFLTYASWSNTMTAEDYRTDNFESFNATDLESYTEGLHGAIDCASTGAGDWDAGTNPFNSGFPSNTNFPGLYIRDDLGNGGTGAGNGLQYITNRTDNIIWQFPYFRVRSAVNGTDTRGKVSFNYSGNNQGRFFFPTGSV